jgi:tellurium resistance protein TerD
MASKSIALGKGATLNLNKAVGGDLTDVTIGLGWKASVLAGTKFDLDAWAVALGDDGKIADDDAEWCVFYHSALKTRDERTTFYGEYRDKGMPCSPGLAIVHTGDVLEGSSGDEDDEVIKIHLDLVPEFVVRIVFPVTIFRAEKRRQNFGMVERAFVRVVDAETNREITRFNLSGEAEAETIVIFGELYRTPDNPNEWEFKAVEAGWDRGVEALMASFGIGIEEGEG